MATLICLKWPTFYWNLDWKPSKASFALARRLAADFNDAMHNAPSGSDELVEYMSEIKGGLFGWPTYMNYFKETIEANNMTEKKDMLKLARLAQELTQELTNDYAVNAWVPKWAAKKGMSPINDIILP